jgi:SAM-dependent methyltransferase
MKTIVSVQEVSEFELKPPAAVAKWRSLVDAEIAARWRDRSRWGRVIWPTCGAKDEIPAFERNGFAYVESAVCGSLYAPVRPGEDELWAWYRDSAPARFWRDELLPASDSARRENIIRPRADWVLDGIAEYVRSATRVLDVSVNGRALVDILAAEGHDLRQIVAAGMTADLEGASTTKVLAQPTRVADLPGHGAFDVVLAFDVMDRAADLGALIRSFEQTLAPGGVVFATVGVASGFEVQALWERSPSILPPDKVNLPSVQGLQKIFAAPEWELLELSTPGMFDVETVHRAIAADPDGPWPRVVRSLVEHTDAAGRQAMVELLQSRRLASFARLVARRKM